ncbi:ARD1, partial [Symbiodinium necroappetens]
APEVKDQTAENRRSPNKAVAPSVLADLGVLAYHVPPTGNYPPKAVPWEPQSGIQDTKLKQIRDARGYNYADIITCSEECLPDYHNKLKAFFEEHIHSDEEVRYILKGSGYFDVRDTEDQWIRIQLNAGDLIVLPEGIYHRFTMDTKNFTQAMRLFKGVPVWTPINRPADTHLSRERYLARFGHFAEEQRLRANIVACLRSFFQLGWCVGSSGAMAARVGSGPHAPVLSTPSGVPKERLAEEVSDSAQVFMAVFEKRTDVRAVCHIHSVSSVLVAASTDQAKSLGRWIVDTSRSVLEVRELEMIKGFGIPGDGVLQVPVIDNKAREPELVPDLLKALERVPNAPAVLVRGHGAYVFGSTAEPAGKRYSRVNLAMMKAKIATECLGFILDVVEKQRNHNSFAAEPSRKLRMDRRVSVGLYSLSPTWALLSMTLTMLGAGISILFDKLVSFRCFAIVNYINLEPAGRRRMLPCIDKLFPFAAASVEGWAPAAGPDLSEVVAQFEAQCQEDGAPFDKLAPIKEVRRLTKEWIANDRKVPALKDLQGRLWRSGYERGALQGEMFEDTPKAMAAWVAAGQRVAIFSSGSREAQRLIFQYSDKGDLTPHIAAYFDPKAAQASKQEAKAYVEIALSLGIECSQGAVDPSMLSFDRETAPEV